jgi:phospholipase C
VPYELSAEGKADLSQQAFRIDFGNTGKATAVYHVRSGNTKTGPWTYTVQPGANVSDSWALSTNPRGAYNLSVYGPNGFLRSFKGSTSGQNIGNLNIEASYDNSGLGIKVEITNLGATCQVSIVDAYSKDEITHTLEQGEELKKHWNLKKSYGWYDFLIEVNTDTTFQRRIAGHVETGEESMTDPAIGAPSPNFI